ncbi:MAG: acryloyl-CoA reductase [Nitriliruptorales bacterium]|nr:acryloyl-CoA reductase [Nitriliruptorales bacterium]
MPDLPDHVNALIVTSSGTAGHRVFVGRLHPEQLGDGEVTIRVAWSSVNYKDGLATLPDGKVAGIDPLVPGVDLSGEVVADDTAQSAPGDHVIAHAHGLGVSHHGGFAEYARVPAEWVVPLPEGLSLRDSMVLGTAGFTAALSVHLLEERGLAAGDGPVLVTGATGGVGSTAVDMLAGRGYEVVAATGKPQAHDFLRRLGASDIVDRADVVGDDSKPLGKQRWAAAVDCVGGAMLAGVIRSMRVGAAVAASGNTGGMRLETSVAPFILRGVALLGVDSVHCPRDLRLRVWQRLASDLRPRHLEELIGNEIDGLGDDLIAALKTVVAGEMTGRAVVRIGA